MCISRCAKVMSGESTPVITATATSKKRELTSPEFDVDFKKNKCASSSTVSISDLDLDISIEQEQENSDKSDEMASNVHVTPSTPSASASSSGAPHIVIPPTEMLKISEMLKETFRGEIVTMVDSVVAGVLKGLQDRITSLEISNGALVQENKSLVTRLEVLEKRVDQAEQYSRRNCLRISGISEEVNENTDNIVMSLASDIGSDVQQSHIDRSHRVGNPKKSSTKPRDIIVKFSTYRYRQAFFKQRTLLKDTGHRGVFVNEDLTKLRSGILYEARKLMKAELIKGAWSSDGNILVKDRKDHVYRVSSLGDLNQFHAQEPGSREHLRTGQLEAAPRSYASAVQRPVLLQPQPGTSRAGAVS